MMMTGCKQEKGEGEEEEAKEEEEEEEEEDVQVLFTISKNSPYTRPDSTGMQSCIHQFTCQAPNPLVGAHHREGG